MKSELYKGLAVITGAAGTIAAIGFGAANGIGGGFLILFLSAALVMVVYALGVHFSNQEKMLDLLSQLRNSIPAEGESTEHENRTAPPNQSEQGR